MVNELLEYMEKLEQEDQLRMFALTVDDWGLPGIVSGAISYLGRRDDLEAFFANMPERHKELRMELEGLYERFLAGEEAVTYYVAYGERRFLTPVTVYKNDSDSYEELSWKCLNVWDYPYKFAAKDVHIRHTWVSFEEDGRTVYARYGRVFFEDIQMSDTDLSDWLCIWGYPGLIAFHENGLVTSTLYLPERYFKNEAELLADIEAPVFEPEEDLRSFLFAIVGDG